MKLNSQRYYFMRKIFCIPGEMKTMIEFLDKEIFYI